MLADDDIQGSHDFFDVGGSSILAVELMVNVQVDLGVHLPLEAVFIHSGFDDQAAIIAQLLGADPHGRT
ncbi:MAG: phosphopantetheine-binding protein [Chloroflexota bacterium]|nr:phosphopantetheine-binding protein [Chloroflexota bacterium]